jgi:hypothetical protein
MPRYLKHASTQVSAELSARNRGTELLVGTRSRCDMRVDTMGRVGERKAN